MMQLKANESNTYIYPSLSSE